MDIRHCKKWNKVAVRKGSEGIGTKRNNFHFSGEEIMYIRRGRKIIRKKCYRTCTPRPGRSGLLQHLFCRSEERRRLASNTKSSTAEHASHNSTFQDGNSEVNNEVFSARGLGIFSGFDRCISTSSGSSTVSEVSQVLCTRNSLPVQSNAFRSCDSSTFIYKGDVDSRELPPKTANIHSHVSGRLASETSRPLFAHSTQNHDHRSSSTVRFADKSREVTIEPNANIGVFGSIFQSEGRDNLSDRNQIFKSSTGDFTINYNDQCSSSQIPATARFDGSMHRFSSPCTLAYAPATVVFPVILAPLQGQFGSTYSNTGPSSTACTLVANEGQYFQRDSVTHPLGSGFMDGCVSDRMGSSHGQSPGFRCMDSSTTNLAYQYARNESSRARSPSFPTAVTRESRSSSLRQFHGSCLYQQAGGDEIPSTVSVDVGCISVGQTESNLFTSSPHSGEKEYFSGRLVEGSSRCENDRVELTPGSCGYVVSEVSTSQHRPVCHSGEQEVADILLSLSGSSGMGVRCSKCQLDRDACLCVSATNSDTAGVDESASGVVCSVASGSIFTAKELVSTTVRTSRRLSKGITDKQKYAYSKKRSTHTSRSRKSTSGSVETIQHKEPASKFSSEAQQLISQSRRPSTSKLYKSRICIYKRWCRQRGINPYSAPVEKIADFLVYLHSAKNCKATTLAGYRSAINSVHKGWNGSSVSANKDISALIKGVFNKCPPAKSLLPNWDLPKVLWALCDSPFEPLDSIDLKFLTWKTVFLIALASAARVSEIHALSVNDNNMRFEQTGVRLLPNLQFIAKTQRLGKPWDPIFIPYFASLATEERDLLLCPCRALKQYLLRTKPLRGNTDCLFITYQKGVHNPAAKSSVSRWIVELVKFVYHNSQDGFLRDVRAHDTRRLASSWALFNGAPIVEILRAARWASESTFTSFYLKDVSWGEESFARASVLNTARLARSRRLNQRQSQ